MLLVVVFVALPPLYVGGKGAGLETGGVFDGPEVGATSYQLDGHELTHPGSLEVW